MTSSAAKQALDFNGWSEQDVLLVQIGHKFDVRKGVGADADDKAIAELDIAGPKSRRPPYITTDLVEVDGRHEIERHRRHTPPPEMIRVRMLPFSWEDLSPAQKAEVRAWALQQNMPDPSMGPRVLADTDDISFNIREYLESGLGETKIRILLHFVPTNQFKKAWVSAYESWKQSNIARVEIARKKDDLTPSATAKLLPEPLRKGYLAIRKANGGLPTSTGGKAGALALRKQQNALDKAVDALGRYSTKLLQEYLNGTQGHSAEITRTVLKYHQATITRLQGKFNKVNARIEAAIVDRESKGRGPNRY